MIIIYLKQYNPLISSIFLFHFSLVKCNTILIIKYLLLKLSCSIKFAYLLWCEIHILEGLKHLFGWVENLLNKLNECFGEPDNIDYGIWTKIWHQWNSVTITATTEATYELRSLINDSEFIINQLANTFIRVLLLFSNFQI